MVETLRRYVIEDVKWSKKVIYGGVFDLAVEQTQLFRNNTKTKKDYINDTFFSTHLSIIDKIIIIVIAILLYCFFVYLYWIIIILSLQIKQLLVHCVTNDFLIN